MKKSMFWFLAVSVAATAVYGQTSVPARTLVTQAVNDGKLIKLSGNTRRAANAANDRGQVAESRQFQHILLLLNRPAEREAALQKYLAQLTDASSPSFHQWLNAKQVGEKFGPANADVAMVREWLTGYGFTVHSVSPTRDLIDFSGTERQIKAAFHTEIHHLSVHGQNHMANMSDPRIPAALGEIVRGIVSLNDFRPHAMHTKIHPADAPAPEYTTSNGYFVLAPIDLATIYSLNPLFAAGLTGKGQTIAVMEDTDLASPADWLAFRKRFALTKAYPYATFSQINPQSDFGEFCSDPGVNSDDDEADLDVQWASAAAPNANIVLAACDDTDFNFGGFIAMENLLLGNTAPPPIISISYGDAEADLGSSFNAYINVLYELAAVEGVSVYVSAGDSGADVFDARDMPATSGISTSGFATTPYNVAVGGTDFADTYFGNNLTYWNSSTAPNGGSAKSYIPEIPWDDSCASSLLTTYIGFSTAYGTNGLCNSATATTANGLLGIVAGSGGPSGCALGDSTVDGVLGGTCAGYPKPSWQRLVGVPRDGVRDIPDVSLFASNGIWSHYYLFCYSDAANGGVPCNQGLFGAGGTSFAAPIMAGFQALVNQRTGTIWGNPNPVLYSIARSEYGASGSASCNSSLGTGTSPACTFYDVTLGDIDIVCAAGSPNCYAPSGANGVLSTSTTSYLPAFPTATGWDFSTGIGSVNAFNLVSNWLAGAAAAASPAP